MKPAEQILFDGFHFYFDTEVRDPDRFHIYLNWFHFHLDIEVRDPDWLHFHLVGFHYDLNSEPVSQVSQFPFFAERLNQCNVDNWLYVLHYFDSGLNMT